MLTQAVDWLRQHDDKAHVIAEAGQKFALQHLNRDSRMCYWKYLLTGLAELFR